MRAFLGQNGHMETEFAEDLGRTIPVIVIASLGRPRTLYDTLLSVATQSVACEVIVSVTSAEDVSPELAAAMPSVRMVLGPKGAAAQRNTGLKAIRHRPECVLFLDDDVELAPEYCREILSCFQHNPTVAVVNGQDLAAYRYPDGITRSFAKQILANAPAEYSAGRATDAGAVKPMNTSYGSLMSLRGDLLGKVFFDQRLVLHGFLEDLDFAMRCLPYGSLARSEYAILVHLGEGSGRVSNARRGYSDIVNPFYIWSKRTGFAFRRALFGSARRTVNNVKTALRTRNGSRLKGNLLGWLDAVRGRLRPERILEL